jgi:non-ribosomal peptide synthetase component E (peptide arylation enzyme)
MIPLPLRSLEKTDEYRANGLWRDVTIAERFLTIADRYPDKIAIVVAGRRASYDEVRDDVLRIAAGLLDHGLRSGDVVAGQLPNSYEIPVLHLACNAAGMLYMPLHDSWRALEVRHLLAQARVKLLISPATYRDFNYAGMIADFRSELPDLRVHFTIDGVTKGAGVRSFQELPSAIPMTADQTRTHRPDPDLPAAIMLSGGTTAISKISRFSSNNLLFMLDIARDKAGFSATDVAAALAPAGTGATGYVYPILMPLMNGATSVILPRWSDPDEATDLMVHERCTYATAIPAQLVKLLPSLRARAPDDFSALRVITNAGAPLPYETAAEVENLTGAVIQTIYGATDGGTPTMTALDDPREKRLGTVGRVVAGCECEIRDINGACLPAGETGEVVWRGADKSWGYLGADDQTDIAFTDEGFYKSGDLGQFDADGYLRIVGRIKDMILRGGRNISPLVIEEALIRHPDVNDVAVAPMPDPVLGERACAFIIVRQGTNMALPEVLSFLKAQGLAVWQLPERLELMDEFPRSAGGKTLKRELTSLVTEKLRAEQTEQQ